jgi:phage baseplate assembly protein W
VARKVDSLFIGQGWSFPPSFDAASTSAALVSEGEDIAQSLRILFSTRPGERIMNPGYGCDIQRFLFKAIDLTEETQIKDMLANAILNYEPRIIVNGIQLDTRGYLDGVLTVSLDYTVRTTNNRANVVYPFYLLEGTLVPGSH